MITIKKITVGMSLVAVASSCSIKPLTDIQPDWTSYPADKVIEEKVNMWIAPGISRYSNLEILPEPDGSSAYSSSSKSTDSVTYDFKQTIVGDTATHEIYILPKKRSLTSEEELFQQVPSKGNKICGKKYEISASKYYFGSEGTLRMSGISSPALKVKYRCPVYEGSGTNEHGKSIRNIAEKFPNHIYFDIIIKSFGVNKVTLNNAVEKAMKAENVRVISSGKNKNINYIYASRNEPFGKKYRILDIVLTSESQDEGSVLKFIYMPYERYVHERGVMGTKKPPSTIGTTPSNRKYTYLRSLVFLSRVDKFLGLGGQN